MSATEEPGVNGVPRLGADLLHRRQNVVDLTGEIFNGMPNFGMHQTPFLFPNHTHEQSVERWNVRMPFRAHNLLISEHTGTHTDAIYEYDEQGPTIDVSPLEYYYGDAICLDLSGIRYPDWIEPVDLEEALEASGQELRRGDIVLLHTGHAARTWPSQAYLTDQAGLSRAAALWLAERGTVNIGIDAVAIDHSDDLDFSGHIVCKEFHIVNTESLRNLDRVVNQRFTFYGLPLYIRQGTGSPIRAIAVLGS
jgi:kynurenine formamidase